MTCQEVVLWGMIPLLAMLTYTYSLDANGRVDRSKVWLLGSVSVMMWVIGLCAVKGWFIWQ